METKEKITFKKLLLLLVIVLIVLPFVTTFSEQLTHIVQSTSIYHFIEKYIVTREVKIVATILGIFNIPLGINGSQISIKGQPMMLTWNCLGWQSMLFLIFTMLTGLQGKYKMSSKIETSIIGILGTFWVNILRITFLVILGGYFPNIFRVLFHDYFATFVTISWMIFFWWFSYSFVLEPKKPIVHEEVVKV